MCESGCFRPSPEAGADEEARSRHTKIVERLYEKGIELIEAHHDFCYDFRKDFFHKGSTTEAGKAVIEQEKKDGLPYDSST